MSAIPLHRSAAKRKPTLRVAATRIPQRGSDEPLSPFPAVQNLFNSFCAPEGEPHHKSWRGAENQGGCKSEWLRCSRGPAVPGRRANRGWIPIGGWRTNGGTCVGGHVLPGLDASPMLRLASAQSAG